ncbi:hypothetical protein GGS20DRAFT_568372 [Poronia punctata]|nr:hypothetical protein GGS20DRAFT_568372 [Poronia punctata]
MAAEHPEFLTPQRVVTSPHRPGHQLRRSITEQPPPPKHHRAHQYLHRKHHDRGDRGPLSAGPEIRKSIDFPRAEAARTGAVPDPNRKTLGSGDEVPNGDEAVTSPRYPLAKHATREQKSDVEAVIASLEKSVVRLNTLRHDTSTRLDETYSSLLHRLGALQNSIMAMRELAHMSGEVSKNFTSESGALTNEIQAQLEIYEQSEDQKKRIQALQTRIHAGRDKVRDLSKRVDVVRERIEGWEKADREWQERTRRRLKIFWIVISAVALILTVLYVGGQYTSSAADYSNLAETTRDNQERVAAVNGIVGNNSKSASTIAEEIREELMRKRSQAAAEEEALRVFDEL